MENLHEWSIKMQGARDMLLAIVERVPPGKFYLDYWRTNTKDNKVYHNAIVALVLSDLRNVHSFLAGQRIGYRNFRTDKKGKLVSCEAYFLT